AFVHVRQTEGAQASDDSFTADVTLADAQGQLLVEVSGLRVQAADAQAIARTTDASGGSNALFRIDWPIAAQVPTAPVPGGTWAVVGAEGDELAEGVASRLRAMGAACQLVSFGGVAQALPADNLVGIWPAAVPDDEQAADEALRLSTDALALV